MLCKIDKQHTRQDPHPYLPLIGRFQPTCFVPRKEYQIPKTNRIYCAEHNRRQIRNVILDNSSMVNLRAIVCQVKPFAFEMSYAPFWRFKHWHQEEITQ